MIMTGDSEHPLQQRTPGSGDMVTITNHNFVHDRSTEGKTCGEYAPGVK